MRHKIAILSLLLSILPIGCRKHTDKEQEETVVNAVTVNLSATVSEDASYPLGSAFITPAVIDAGGSNWKCMFYRGSHSAQPDGNDDLVVEFTNYLPDKELNIRSRETISRINIYGLSSSLGLGEELSIPLNCGKYEGGNEIVNSVLLKTIVFGRIMENDRVDTKGEIDILITTKKGDEVKIFYKGTITPILN